jgi:hypothetical protein
VFWRLADADFVDRYVIRPMIAIARKFNRLIWGGQGGPGK